MEMNRYLDDLENRLDPAEEAGLHRQWQEFYSHGSRGAYFQPTRTRKIAAGCEWPDILINDALEDMSLMAIRELKRSSDALAGGSGSGSGIRIGAGGTGAAMAGTGAAGMTGVVGGPAGAGGCASR